MMRIEIGEQEIAALRAHHARAVALDGRRRRKIEYIHVHLLLSIEFAEKRIQFFCLIHRSRRSTEDNAPARLRDTLRLSHYFARHKAWRHQLAAVEQFSLALHDFFMLTMRIMHNRLQKFPGVEVNQIELICKQISLRALSRARRAVENDDDLAHAYSVPRNLRLGNNRRKLERSESWFGSHELLSRREPIMKDQKSDRHCDRPIALANESTCTAHPELHRNRGIASEALRLARDRMARGSVRLRGAVFDYDPETLRLKAEVKALKDAWLVQRPRPAQ